MRVYELIEELMKMKAGTNVYVEGMEKGSEGILLYGVYKREEDGEQEVILGFKGTSEGSR